MTLTNPEKLILMMLAKIHEKLEINDGIDTKLLQNAIFTDNTWALSWEMPGIIGDSDEPTPKNVTDVVDILDMWSFIEEACESFGDEDIEKIRNEADTFGNCTKFVGFDANHDSKYLNIARFLIDDMNRFTRFKGRELNSTTSVETYRRMVDVFLPIRKTLVDFLKLNADQVIQILKQQKSKSV